MNEFERRQKAVQRVEQLRGFYTHTIVYLLVNTLLVAINIATSLGDWWFYWPLFGWGIGLAAHAAVVFGMVPFLGPDWEERKVQELMGDVTDAGTR